MLLTNHKKIFVVILPVVKAKMINNTFAPKAMRQIAHAFMISFLFLPQLVQDTNGRYIFFKQYLQIKSVLANLCTRGFIVRN